jgi:gas vesicle protein
MSAGKVLLGLMAGVAIGATLGILFAPEKGEYTRKKISKKGDDYAQELEDKFSEFIESLSAKFESVKKDVVQMGENGKKKVEDEASSIWEHNKVI